MDRSRPCVLPDVEPLGALPWWRRARMVFLAAFLLLVLAVGAAQVAALARRYENARTEALTSRAETTQALVSATELLIAHYVRTVETTGRLIFDETGPPPAMRHRVLLAVRATHPEIDGVIVLEPSGRVVDADPSVAQLIGRDLSDRAYFEQIASGASLVVGDLILSYASGIASIPIAAAGRGPDGALRGVIVFGVRAAAIARQLELRLGGDAFAVLTDRSGRLIFHGAFPELGWESRDYSHVPAVVEALAGRHALWTGARSPVTNQPRIGAMAPVPELGWAVGVLQPVDTVLAPAREERRAALVTVGLVLALGLLLASGLGLWLSRPVGALAGGVTALARGDFAHRVRVRWRNEFGWLGEAFNAMAARLQAAQRQERELNDELTIANEELQANMARLEESLAELESARARSAFLAEASRQLAGSLDYETTLASVARLAVPDLADWCFVDLLGGDGSTRRVALAHADPSDDSLAAALRDVSFDLRDAHPVAEGIRAGQAIVVPEVTDDYLRGIARDEARLEKLRALGPTSYIFMPLVARGRKLGVITFTATRSRRQYGSADLALAEELGQRAALAVDNARLYQDAQTAQAELRRAAAALEVERGRFEAVLRQMPGGVIVADAESRRLFLSNAQAAEVLGMTSTPATSIDEYFAHEAFHPDGRPYRKEDRPLIRSLRSGEVVSGEEMDIVRPDGGRARIMASSAPVRDRDGRIVAGVATLHDLTERKRMEAALRATEEQLRQAQKMEAVGRLAGGVAHDFNNLLTAITGYSELLLGGVGEGAVRKDLEEIRKAADRAAALTRQLLAFSRQQVLEPRVLDLNAVVADMESMLRRLIGEDVDLVALRAPALGRIKADPGQVEQVLMNLVVNARDAMPDGGKLTIETANVDLDDAYARRHVSVRAGSYVMLAVSDTGIGMDAETQTHVFEPFFTTKAPGKGTGLGLSTVYGIVKQSGGHIWVYSEPGKGTTVKIYVPRVDGPLGEAATAPLTTPKAARGETILLVEDDPGVRALACRILTAAGYTVLAAQDGAEALRVNASHEGEIALVLTDMVMPEMNGHALAERLTAARPGLRILYMSGYTDKAILRQQAFEPGVAFVDKPFTPIALARKVQEMLDAPGRERA